MMRWAMASWILPPLFTGWLPGRSGPTLERAAWRRGWTGYAAVSGSQHVSHQASSRALRPDFDQGADDARTML